MSNRYQNPVAIHFGAGSLAELPAILAGRPTLHERVALLGEAVAMSNVSPGAAYVHDPEDAGYVFHRSGSFGPGRRRIDVVAELVDAGFKISADSSDVVVAPQGTAVIIHLAVEARSRMPEMVQWLRRQDFAGHVVAGQALADLGLPCEGTLAIAVSLAGDDETNAFGVRGRSDVAENALGGESLPGHGQHGGLGDYEQRPFLVVRGPGFARRTHRTAASLIDLAPTILRHLALPRDGIEGSALPTQ